MNPDYQGTYFALACDGFMYCLGDCGDYDAAEESAKDLDIDAVWITNEDIARQWLHNLSLNLKGKDNGQG